MLNEGKGEITLKEKATGYTLDEGLQTMATSQQASNSN